MKNKINFYAANYLSKHINICSASLNTIKKFLYNHDTLMIFWIYKTLVKKLKN